MLRTLAWCHDFALLRTYQQVSGSAKILGAKGKKRRGCVAAQAAHPRAGDIAAHTGVVPCFASCTLTSQSVAPHSSHPSPHFQFARNAVPELE